MKLEVGDNLSTLLLVGMIIGGSIIWKMVGG